MAQGVIVDIEVGDKLLELSELMGKLVALVPDEHGDRRDELMDEISKLFEECVVVL